MALFSLCERCKNVVRKVLRHSLSLGARSRLADSQKEGKELNSGFFSKASLSRLSRRSLISIRLTRQPFDSLSRGIGFRWLPEWVFHHSMTLRFRLVQTLCYQEQAGSCLCKVFPRDLQGAYEKRFCFKGLNHNPAHLWEEAPEAFTVLWRIVRYQVSEWRCAADLSGSARVRVREESLVIGAAAGKGFGMFPTAAFSSSSRQAVQSQWIWPSTRCEAVRIFAMVWHWISIRFQVMNVFDCQVRHDSTLMS